MTYPVVDTVFTQGTTITSEWLNGVNDYVNESNPSDHSAANVTYDPPFTGAVATNVEAKLAQTVSVKDFGAVGDGIADDTAAIQAAIDYGMGNNQAIYFPSGTYLVNPGLVALTNGSASSDVLCLIGEPASAGRHYSMPSKIVFADDGTTTGLIGLDSAYVSYFQYIQFDTQAGDARAKSGDFIGIRAPGGSLCVEQCIFMGCSGSALKVSDVGYASMTDCIFRYNKVGFQEYLNVWAASTTASFTRVHGFQNGDVFNTPTLYHSSWSECIWEYNDYGVHFYRQGCEFTGNYAENNTSYGAYSDNAANAIFIGNFSYGAGDTFYVSGSTGSFGFDSIGAYSVIGNAQTVRSIQFYNRSGGLDEVLKASSNSGQPVANVGLAVYNASGDFIGYLPKEIALNNGGIADQTVRFLLKGTTDYGVPSGWTVTKVATGRWEVRWPSPVTGDTRWPYIHVNGITATDSQADILATVTGRSNAGVWSSFANMNLGFDVYIYSIDPTTGIMVLTDAAAMVQVTW